MTITQIIILIIAGLIAGLVGGTLGVGGGIIIIPVLIDTQVNYSHHITKV